MEQQDFEEYFDRNVGQALQRLGQLQPGQSISFVGIRALAEVLVDNAVAQGMKIEAVFRDGFNAHILTLLERTETISKVVPQKIESEPVMVPGKISGWQLWIRERIAGFIK